MALKTTIAIEPTEEPINEREAKEHMRVEIGDTVEDELIKTYIKAARECVENFTGRALLNQTWDYYLDKWPAGDEILLPYPPLIWTVGVEVSYVKYTDSNGVLTPLVHTTDYVVDTDREPGRIVLAYGKSWPCTTLHPRNPIHIRYNCGWIEPEAIPAMLRVAVMLTTSDMYENREPTLIGVSAQTLKTLDRILCDYIDYTWKV